MQRFLAKEFDAVCRRAGSRPAVVDEGATLSYRRLLRWSETITMQLDRNQDVDGCRFALLLPNSAAFIASFLGVARVGGVVAPLNVGYRSQELEHYLSDMDASAVLVSAATANAAEGAIRRLSRKPALLLVDFPGRCEVLSQGDVLGALLHFNGNPPLLLLYTSGSTGPPKRVVRSHAHLLAEIETLHALFGVGPHDRFLGVAPFSHVNGLVRSMLTAILAGATIYPLRQFALRPVLQLISKERLTFFGGVPQMFILLAQTPRRGDFDLSSLQVVFSSSAPLTLRDNRDFQRVYGFCVRQLYGSSETGTISYNDHPEVGEHLESVGRALTGVTVTVIDDDGRPLPPCSEGEIGVSSRFAISSYEGNEATTEMSFRDGLYLTGDIGRMDFNGSITLTGRKSIMVNRGGYKVNPYEVEQAIRLHPKVTDVVVYGAPGPHGDQIVRCRMVVREACTAEEIILHCRGRIADYKIPSSIEFSKSLPRTPTGKVVRDRL